MDEKFQVFQFDDVRIEPAAFRVWKSGAAVALEPKAFEVLLFFIQNSGRVVTKRELLDAVWKDTFVSENALTREIALLRKALGEEARKAKYIETVPTRGYRFIAEIHHSVSRQTAHEETCAHSLPQVELESRTATAPHAPLHSLTPTTNLIEDAAPRINRRRSLWRFAVPFVAVVLFTVAAGALFWNLRGKTAGKDETIGVRRITQVTTSTALDFFPSISPDGGYVAYSSNRGGSFEIYVRQLAPGGREIQITADGALNFQPAWSPDGQRLAYHSRKRGGIWLVPAMGGVARRLADFGSKPAWSRDGQQIAFQSATLHDVTGVQGGALPPSTLWTVPAEGGPARQLTKAGQPSGGHGSPVWSPDDKWILFYAYDLWLGEIWSVSTKTGELKQLAPNGQPFSDIIFAPDGKHIYCAGLFKGGSFGLWRVPVSLDAGRPTGEPEKVEGTGATPIRYLSISADGRKIAYSTISLESNIWQLSVSPVNGEATGPPAPLFEDTSQRKTNPIFSPDGKWIAFGVWRLGSPTNIWLTDAEGRNPVPLTTDSAGSGVPNWMPDKERLAYVTFRLRRPALWTKNLKTDEEKPLLELDTEGGIPRLSPDGRRIAYNSRRQGGRINIWTQALDGGPPRQLTFDEELMGFPCWSPDGKWLALEAKRGDDNHIFIMPSEGGQPVQLTREPGLSWPHSFSPDGDKIAFARMSDGVWNLYWVSRQTGEQQRLTNFSRLNGYVRYPAWSPLGDRIVFEHAVTTGNVWLMELK